MSTPHDINDYVPENASMWLLLRVLSEGKARFEKSGSSRAFFFDGILYAYHDNPGMIVAVIGSDRLKAALRK